MRLVLLVCLVVGAQARSVHRRKALKFEEQPDPTTAWMVEESMTEGPARENEVKCVDGDPISTEAMYKTPELGAKGYDGAVRTTLQFQLCKGGLVLKMGRNGVATNYVVRRDPAWVIKDKSNHEFRLERLQLKIRRLSDFDDQGIARITHRPKSLFVYGRDLRRWLLSTDSSMWWHQASAALEDNLNGDAPFNGLAASHQFMYKWSSGALCTGLNDVFQTYKAAKVHKCARPLKLQSTPCAANAVTLNHALLNHRGGHGSFEGVFTEDEGGPWLFLPFQENTCTYMLLPAVGPKFVGTSEMGGCSFLVLKNRVTGEYMASHCNANDPPVSESWQRVQDLADRWSEDPDGEIVANVIWKTCMGNSLLQAMIKDTNREWEIVESLHRREYEAPAFTWAERGGDGVWSIRSYSFLEGEIVTGHKRTSRFTAPAGTPPSDDLEIGEGELYQPLPEAWPAKAHTVMKDENGVATTEALCLERQ